MPLLKICAGSVSPFFTTVLPQGKHNMAVPEGGKGSALTSLADGTGQQYTGGAGTALGGSQASGEEATEEKVRFF